MIAAVYRCYGPADVVQLEEVPEPRPRRGEVRVRVRAAALNPKDVLVRKGRFRLLAGRRFPRIPGYDFAGTVEALGPDVGALREGDPVFGMKNGWDGGTCAELVAVSVAELWRKPECLGWAEAAALPLAGLTALQALRDLLRVRTGELVVINGAAGGVGTMAVQIARALGAEVVAICGGRNAELVRGLGAARVLDYAAGDPLRELGSPADAFFDVFGNRPYHDARRALSRRGRYVSTVPAPPILLREMLARAGLGRARLVLVRSTVRDLEQLSEWAQTGRLEPVIDRVLPLERVVEAQQHLETRHARGKIVLTPVDPDRSPSTRP